MQFLRNFSLAMKLFTVTPAYLPALAYFWKIAQCDILILTDHLQFTKRSPATISAPMHSNMECLRIPVYHDSPQKPIAAKRIDLSDNWKKKHLTTIRHLYHNLPFAYHFLPLLEEIYSNEEEFFLSPFLHRLIEQFLHWLHLPAKVFASSGMKITDSPTELIREWHRELQCSHYINDDQVFSNGWVDRQALENDSIACDTLLAIPDAHIFQAQAKISILEFLCLYGPEAGYLIRQFLP
jgi:hypothetical protein